MGVGSPGFDGQIRVSGSSISSKTDGAQISKVSSVSISISDDPLDVTGLEDSGIDNLKGVKDSEISVDTYQFQNTIESDFIDENNIHLAVFPDSNSLGITGQFIVIDTSISSDVDSAAQYSFTAVLNDSSGYSVIT